MLISKIADKLFIADIVYKISELKTITNYEKENFKSCCYNPQNETCKIRQVYTRQLSNKFSDVTCYISISYN